MDLVIERVRLDGSAVHGNEKEVEAVSTLAMGDHLQIRAIDTMALLQMGHQQYSG